MNNLMIKLGADIRGRRYNRLGLASKNERISYAGKEVPTIEEGNLQIKSLIQQDSPVMIARFGGNELQAFAEGVLTDFPIQSKNKEKKILKLHQDFFITAGFFPQDVNLLGQFADLMKESCSQLDMLGVWFNSYEDYMIENYAPQSKLCRLRSIEPYYCLDDPWTTALEGKKVLVIHPFADTISEQYRKRKMIYPNTNVLPNMELVTMKSVQTMAYQNDNNFKSWFDALEYMHEETKKYDFDVAILGCGAYGFPLAAKIKKDGHSAIHMGGATQILFGIKGKRWDNHEYISKLYNESWVRPSVNEQIKNVNLTEGGGHYW